MIPVIAVAAQKVHHLVHPVHNQPLLLLPGTEKKNIKREQKLRRKHPLKRNKIKLERKSHGNYLQKNHLTMKIQIKTEKR